MLVEVDQLTLGLDGGRVELLGEQRQGRQQLARRVGVGIEDRAPAARLLDASRPVITYCHDSL